MVHRWPIMMAHFSPQHNGVISRNMSNFDFLLQCTAVVCKLVGLETRVIIKISNQPFSNVSTTPLRQWDFRQFLSFSWTTLRGKHCQHPVAVMRVVDADSKNLCSLNLLILNIFYEIEQDFSFLDQ